jgi:hypothetical protein
MVDISIVHGSYNFKPTNIARRHHHIPVISPLYLLYIYIFIYVVGGFNHLETYESQWEG